MGLSLGLPLQGEAFEDQQCQISRQNDFGLLELIGGGVPAQAHATKPRAYTPYTPQSARLRATTSGNSQAPVVLS